MKKLFFVFGLSLMTSGVFANELKEEVNVENKKAEVAIVGCCTATLTYNGQYVDHAESCSTELTTEQNCAFARRDVLRRNPAAAIALGN
jgi:hypothetical protein